MNTRPPEYKWRCLECQKFVEPEVHTLFSTYPYGLPLRLCPDCKKPLALVHIRWKINKKLLKGKPHGF